METIEAKYDEQARDAGVYIVSSCGFDSIPNDLGALMVQKSFNGDLAYVDSYVTLHGKNVSWYTCTCVPFIAEKISIWLEHLITEWFSKQYFKLTNILAANS